MYVVHPQSDKVRALTAPADVLMHTFTAKSSFEAFRHHNEWFGYEPWVPPEALSDHYFAEEEVAEQREYLKRRHEGRRAAALSAIKQLLRDDWDPIGLVPHLPADEYDTYAMQVFSKISGGASIDEIADYLGGVDMGGEPDRARDRLVAEKAVAIMSRSPK